MRCSCVWLLRWSVGYRFIHTKWDWRAVAAQGSTRVWRIWFSHTFSALESSRHRTALRWHCWAFLIPLFSCFLSVGRSLHIDRVATTHHRYITQSVASDCLQWREREERVNKGMRQKRTQWSGVVRQLIKLCRWILVQLRLGRKKKTFVALRRWRQFDFWQCDQQGVGEKRRESALRHSVPSVGLKQKDRRAATSYKSPPLDGSRQARPLLILLLYISSILC